MARRDEEMVNKVVDWLLWGFFMGIGWTIGVNVLGFIGGFMHH